MVCVDVLGTNHLGRIRSSELIRTIVGRLAVDVRRAGVMRTLEIRVLVARVKSPHAFINRFGPTPRARPAGIGLRGQHHGATKNSDQHQYGSIRRKFHRFRLFQIAELKCFVCLLHITPSGAIHGMLLAFARIGPKKSEPGKQPTFLRGNDCGIVECEKNRSLRNSNRRIEFLEHIRGA